MKPKPHPHGPRKNGRKRAAPRVAVLKEDLANARPLRRESASVKGAPFPIVALGSSAGGLEALEHFFAGVPERSGIGFVVIQHLDPSREALLAELLQRSTPLKVVQVSDRTPVKPECVYVIPPNKDLSILHGVLHLLEPIGPRGMRLPIDFFFRSLAADRGAQSIGVILSGMGSDGALGVAAIKEASGLVLVQDPDSAKFDSMPRSAVQTGLTDIVAPAGELATRLLEWLHDLPTQKQSLQLSGDMAEGGLEKIVILLRERTRHDFSSYKKSSLRRRVERRMLVHQLGNLKDYLKLLQANPQEQDLLFKELLIGVTNFFRDASAWEQLQDSVIPALLSRQPFRGSLRAWVPACSSGEEAYSLAISFREAVAKRSPKQPVSLQIFATDLDRGAIERARLGVYPLNIAADVSPERLERYFVRQDDGYRICKEIREMVIFSLQNVVMDPPFTRLDLLCCRNFLIYIELTLQRKLIPLFHYCLQPGGVLFLGNSETVGSFSHLFNTLGGKGRFFLRESAPMVMDPLDFPSSFVPTLLHTSTGSGREKPGASFQSQAEQLILQRLAPAAILANERGDILFINGRTGRFLEPASGKANWNLFAMTRDTLRYELLGAFQKVVREKHSLQLPPVRVRGEDFQGHLEVALQWIAEPDALKGLVLVVFNDLPLPVEKLDADPVGREGRRSARVVALEDKLSHAHEELQAVQEQMRLSQEELHSAIEELQSTNEELQSTNEELTTSKEELQSLNEELQTVNAELQGKVDELSRTHSDMQNLLNSIDIATVFLDNNLRLRRFTTQASRVIQLLAGDVGRPLTDLASSLVYPTLNDDAQEVLRTLGSVERRVPGREGREYAVRICPYRTSDNRIDGVAITFLDISRYLLPTKGGV